MKSLGAYKVDEKQFDTGKIPDDFAQKTQLKTSSSQVWIIAGIIGFVILVGIMWMLKKR